MTPNADAPASNPPVKAALPCPMADMTPTAVTTGSDGIEFPQEQIRQLADVPGTEQLDARHRQAERLLHEHRAFGAIDRVGAQVHQAVRGEELVGIESRQDFARMPRDERKEFRLGHDGLLHAAHATVTAARARSDRSSTISPSN